MGSFSWIFLILLTPLAVAACSRSLEPASLPLSAWMESCYRSQPGLHFGEHTIRSRCRVQQGDALGPLDFALILQPIVERIKKDDGILCGSPEDLLRAMEIVEEDGPPRGLSLNRSKSLLFIPQDADVSNYSLPAEIPISSSGFCLLGSPIGPTAFCESIVMSRVEKIRTAVRHDALRDVLYSAAQSAALAPRKQTPSLIPGSCSHPANVFLPIWCRGCPAALDVSVISTLQPHTLYGAANNHGHALKVAED